ncbi:MAG TPA: hypothetical protein VK143_05810 [Burkholderiales bacterium]|nr:hypothetical protein [Burkholderiales bacterium]
MSPSHTGAVLLKCLGPLQARRRALTPLPRWLGIAMLLVIAVTFSLNHIAARVAFGLAKR